KAGGYKGRSLQKDDELPLHNPADISFLLKENEFMVFPWQADIHWNDNDKEEVFLLPGKEWERLSNEAKESFATTSFMITNQSDRMGYRLNHQPLNSISNEEVVSSAVSFGTIQLLPDGRMIILMADHQTTGGYPRIVHVITAHHSKLAQMKAGDKIYFRLTDQQTAENLIIKQQQHLLQLENACKFRLEQIWKS
ncbi:MAG: KipI antagonist, partial [Chitinophagaceae bacterium]